jgi:hypothetical protein
MLRRQLFRPLTSGRRQVVQNGARSFIASANKRAEVELTIGMKMPTLRT